MDFIDCVVRAHFAACVCIYSILYLLVWLFHSIKIGKVGEMVKVVIYDTTFFEV